MSGICGWVGRADPAVLDAMLAAIDYRGDRTDTEVTDRAALGYRWWGGRPGKSPGLHRDGASLVACAGTLAPPVPSPAARLLPAAQRQSPRRRHPRHARRRLRRRPGGTAIRSA